MAQIFWGRKPSDHAPKIGGIQFILHMTVTDKVTANRIAKQLRADGNLARVQKKTLTSTFGKRKKVVGHCYAIFKAHSKKFR